MAVIKGTSGADSLKALAEGDRVLGLAGRDDLSSRFNRTVLDGGDGRDTLLSNLMIDGPTASARQIGGGDRDTMTLRMTVEDDEVRTATATLSGGEGNDHMISRVVVVSLPPVTVVGPAPAAPAGPTELVTRIDGGAGNDRLRAESRLSAIDPDASVATEASGGIGDDRINVRSTMTAASSRATGTADIDGGIGNDRIDSVLYNRSEDGGTLLASITGGGGDDRIQAAAAFDEADISVIRQSIQGGSGNDEIESTLALTTAGQSLDFVASVHGGLGDDRIESIIYLTDLAEENRAVLRTTGGEGNDNIVAGLIVNSMVTGGTTIDFVNRIEGGAGNDTIYGGATTGARSLIYGEDGNDTLTAAGEARVVLDGGAGNDRLTVAQGEDALVGGGGVDSYVFRPSEDQGEDTLRDFDGDRDKLIFLGLEDEGPAGIVDDLTSDYIEDVVEVGDDVFVTFSSGTVLIFEDCATGSVDSIDDLVDDPATQILTEPDVIEVMM